MFTLSQLSVPIPIPEQLRYVSIIILYANEGLIKLRLLTPFEQHVDLKSRILR